MVERDRIREDIGMKREFSYRNLLRMAAAYCAAYMGAAFISGQETLQFYTAFGWWGIVGMVLVLSVLSYEGLCLHTTIYEHHLSDPYQALDILCGPRVGKIFTAVALVLLVANLISMSAGSGAVMVENYGLPNLLGRCIVMGGAVLVVWLGLDRIVEILGFVGPVTIALLLFVSIVSLAGALHPLPEGMAMAPEVVAFKGAHTWQMSAVKYLGSAVLLTLPLYMIAGVRSLSRKEAQMASFTSLIPLVAVWILVLCAQAGSISVVGTTEIPNVMLARLHTPFLAPVFGACILLGTFCGMTIILWSLVRKVAEEGTRKYRVLTASIGAVVLVASGLLPFSRILNLTFSVAFWIGFILLGLMIAGRIRMKRQGKEQT